MSERDRISRIETLWSVVRRAHDGGDGAKAAQEDLLQRYADAIRRYLLGAVRDENVADELFQEFSLRFVKGDYASANPDRGRFRAFLKTILSRLVAEHFRKLQRRKSLPMGSAVLEPTSPDGDTEAEDETFAKIWREELLSKAWSSLAQFEREKDRPVYTVMDAFVSNPELSSSEQAVQLSERLGKPISAQNARVILHRARAEFAGYLVEEVRNTLERPSRESLEQELIDLRLHKYCRPVLDRD